jgi:large subunit ribosomal protein L28
MSRQCEICGKKPLKAAKRSFSNKANVYRQIPNLQSVKAVISGVVKKARVCTSCIKANKVKKAV